MGERKTPKRIEGSGKPPLTHARLRAVLNYDPITGLFTWALRTSNRIKVGAVAGSPLNIGYVQIQVDGVNYTAHWLAWFWMTGAWPDDETDHKDLDRSNTKWENLRAASSTQNKANRAAQSNNSTGLKGVHTYKRRGKGWYKSSIQSEGVSEHLGIFDCPAAAFFAYQIAADKRFGEYARIG